MTCLAFQNNNARARTRAIEHQNDHEKSFDRAGLPSAQPTHRVPRELSRPILSYNNIPFDDVDDIFASLQWGENPDKGEIYEPSRAQMEFKISGQNKCKYIAYLDLKERTLVYMDANFSGYVNSAASNEGIIAEKMPAFVEYLNSLPSVYDLLKYAHTPDGTIPVVYSDETVDIADGQAFVFRPTNPDNNFTQIELNDILNAT